MNGPSGPGSRSGADSSAPASAPAGAGASSSAPLLAVEDLRTHFFTGEGVARAVDGISFHVDAGEVLGMVGESGCGKSVTSLSLMRLVADPPGRIVGGRIQFAGRDLVRLSEEEMRQVRGRSMAMIFQEPMTSLNPVFTVGEQVAEGMRVHLGLSRSAARERAVELLATVGIPSPRERAGDYPHRFSGGMRQRIMIAMALACQPRLVICDEPTTALDVTVQAQILELLEDLRARLKMAILLITHDLAVVAQKAHRVVVMYAGKIVEEAPVRALFADPRHPYTRGLMGSIARIDRRTERLTSIEGVVPSARDWPAGCRFAARCKDRMTHCTTHEPPMMHIGPGHQAACWLYGSVAPMPGGDQSADSPIRGSTATRIGPSTESGQGGGGTHRGP